MTERPAVQRVRPAARLPRGAEERSSGAAARAGEPLPAWVRWALGGLWLLDTLLQAQPGMFTMDMLSDIMQPAAQGQPAWVAGAVHWGIGVVTPHLVGFNLAFVAIQAAIAAALLVPNARWNRRGLWLSVLWSAVVWLFGEGLGQVLTGSATALTGAPGSVALYGAIAALLLLGWGRGRPEPLPYARPLAAGLFVAGALAQTAPVFWTPMGLSSVFQGQLMMQPHWLAATMEPVVVATAQQPGLWNAVFILAMAASAWAVWWRSPWGCALVGVWLALVWWFGQGVGMLLTGMSTDPNSAPLLALLVLAAAMERSPREVRDRDGEGRGAARI